MNSINGMALSQGIAHYNEPRQEDDIDLVQVVREILTARGANDDNIKLFMNSVQVKQAEDRRPWVQRFLLNRYLVGALSASSMPSMDVRCYLVQNGPIEDWVSYFNDHVADFFLKNCLAANS